MSNSKDLHASPRVEQLLKAAAEMFLDQGYGAFSIDSLIERVGGSKRNVYAHFRGKEGLFNKIMTDLCNEIREPLVKIEISNIDPEAALKKYGSEVLRLTLMPRTLALHRLMISESSRFPGLSNAIWNAGHGATCKALEKWISKQQENKKLSEERSAELLSTQFISMVLGYPQLRALLNPAEAKISKKDASTFIEDTVASFLRGNALPQTTSRPKIQSRV